jgi:hypothetical protein
MVLDSMHPKTINKYIRGILTRAQVDLSHDPTKAPEFIREQYCFTMSQVHPNLITTHFKAHTMCPSYATDVRLTCGARYII